MVCLKKAQSLITVLTTLSLWRVRANIPLQSSDSEHDATVQLLEKSLLNILGMDKRPRNEKPTVIPQYMLDLYHQQSEDSDYMSLNFNKRNTHHANTARSFHHIGTKTHQQDGSRMNIFFNLSSIPSDESITAAELHLAPHNKTARYRINVYEILSSPQSPETSITRLIDTQLVKGAENSIYLDVTSAAHRWHKRSKRTVYGVQVHVRPLQGESIPNNHVRLRRDTSLSDSQWRHDQPLVVVYTNDNRLSRTKRGTKRRKNRSGSKRVKQECQRRDMKVDFADIGWQDWILAPKEYNAYYCHGECPFPLSDSLNATNHAIVQTIVSEVDPGAVPKPCCVPTDLSAMSLLYVPSLGEVVLKTYQDMIVEGCGCR